MRSTLEALLVAISELRTFIDSTEAVYHLLAKHDDPAIRGNLRRRRQLDYTAFVITLYSAFEKFVEDLAWSHAELDSGRVRYFELPDRLQQNHLRNSADLLARSRLGEGRYTGVGELEVVANLYACLADRQEYKLNRHAIVYHDMNLRESVIQGLFSAIGIENVNNLIRRAAPILEWLQQKQADESDLVEIPGTLIALRLDDLVDRRNQVAHSGVSITETLNPEEMSERLDFLEAYSRSLFDVVAGSYLYRRYVGPRVGIELGKPKELLKNKNVAVLSAPPCRLWVGQPILGERQGQVYRWGRVMSLKMNDQSVTSIEAGTAEVGLGFSFTATRGTSFYVLEEEDEVVWESRP